MRVFVVAHGFPPGAQGGGEIYADEHARALAGACGDDVWVFTREQDPTRAEYEVRHESRDGLRITWVNNTFRDVRTFEESYRNERIAAIAAGIVDTHRPDVAHIHHLTCLSTEIVRGLAARGIPSVLTLHDYWFICHRGQLLDVHYRRCAGPGPDGCDACIGSAAPPIPPAAVPLARAIDRRLPAVVSRGARRLVSGLAPAASRSAAGRRLDHMRTICGDVTHFLSPSRSLRERFIQFGVAPERITLSAYGFDHHLFAAGLRTAPSMPLHLGFVGSLMASKAPHVLLEAHRRLPANAATVVLHGALVDYHGDGEYRRVLDPLLAAPGVRLSGPRPHRDIPAALASLDVLVVPSIWEENSPLIIWEAMLAGLPVIASRIGGIPEIVEHGRNGLLFEPGDVDDLQRMLQRVLDEPDLLQALSAGARATTVRTIEDDVRQARGLYEALIAARSMRRRRIAAIVLNHRSTDETLLAVSALLASNRRPDVIVVDNDVADECRAPLAHHGDDVRYLHTGTNLGFAGGMNVGIRAALDRGADHVLLVNADVYVPPDCVERLQSALVVGNTGIVGPLVRSRSLPDLVASAGIDYNLRTGRMRHRAFGARVSQVTGNVSGTVADDRRDAVSGCAMLISRAVFDRVGLFDERYFFGFEEIDLCLRARAAGFDTRLVASATVYHEGGRSIGPRSTRRFYFAARNHLLLASTLGARRSAWSRAALVVVISALNVAHAVRARGGTLPARLVATARGIRDHVRRRYGPDNPHPGGG